MRTCKHTCIHVRTHLHTHIYTHTCVKYTRRYLGTTDYESAALRHGGVNLASLPALSQRHFPLCMQTLMSQLKVEHHLRHGGRQQLGMFLKVRVCESCCVAISVHEHTHVSQLKMKHHFRWRGRQQLGMFLKMCVSVHVWTLTD